MSLTEMSYRRWVIIAAGLFGIGIVIGIAVSLVAPKGITSLLVNNLSAIQELVDIIAGLPPPLMAALIFINNVFTLVTNYIFSPILCLFPILALTVNGCLIGFISPAVVGERSLAFLLTGLLPHGVFEIPALIMGEAAALSIGTSVMVALFRRESRGLLVPRLKETSKYLAMAVALLVPAAFIETFVTPLLLT